MANMHSVTISNEWSRLYKEMHPEFQIMLQQTFPTPALGMLLEAKIRSIDKDLTNIDMSKEPVPFKERYLALKREQEFAKSLLAFAKSLNSQAEER